MATSAAIDAAGWAGSKLAIAFATRSSIRAPPGNRRHEWSNPSRIDVRVGAGAFASASASMRKYSTIGARDRATPKPWLLCMLRLSAAISP